MLIGINSECGEELQKKFNVRQQLVKLGKKYRKLDKNVKMGIVEMEKNFIYYLNCGSNIDELMYFYDHHNRECRNLLSQWSNTDKNFNKNLRGRMIVLSEISKVFTGEI